MDKLDFVVIGILVAGGAYYVHTMSKQRPPQQVPPPATSPATPGSGTPTTTPPPGGGQVTAPPQQLPEAATNPHKDGIVLKTSELEVELSTSGASVRAATLRNILESTYGAVQSGDDDKRDKKPFQLLRPMLDQDGKPRLTSFATAPVGAAWTRERGARTDWAHEALEGGGHRFSLDLGNGLRMVKTYAPPLPSDQKEIRYDVEMTVAVENHGTQEASVAYSLEGPVGVVDQSSDRKVRGQQAAIGRVIGTKVTVEFLAATKGLDLEKPDLNVVVPDDSKGSALTFFGLETKYFAAVVLPKSAPLARAEARGAIPLLLGRKPTSDEEKDADSLAHQALITAQTKSLTLGPGQQRVDSYLLYLGPKNKDIFEDAKGTYPNRGLEFLIDFGWFEFLARIMLRVLQLFHWIVGNWGISIILLTFLVRALLAPLSLWSQKNVLRMQKLGPELNKLKEKYQKKDGSMTPEAQREFAGAQMAMFREHGVNPIGCVGPIFLQLPIFVGLWNALNYAFELREANFVGWIGDLSVPDVLFRLPITLPMLGTNAFSVLPLVMVCMYFLQMHLQPTPSDPKALEQQKMMKFMMPIFGLFMYTMPSGLMVYFITSAGWSMIESKIVKQHLARTEGMPAPVVAK